MKQYLRGWLDLLRISNAPTCISNVLVGWVIGGGTTDFIPLTIVCGIVIAIYLAGMILNDVLDVEWDRRHRPDRPIAAGLISRGMACSVAIIMLIAATGAAAWLGPATFTATLLLVGLVIAYDLVHRIAVAAIITMSACRAMVYLVAAIAAGEAVPEPLLIGAMLAIALWIAGLTLLARREAVGQVPVLARDSVSHSRRDRTASDSRDECSSHGSGRCSSSAAVPVDTRQPVPAWIGRAGGPCLHCGDFSAGCLAAGNAGCTNHVDGGRMLLWRGYHRAPTTSRNLR